jgi:carbon starvation protein
VGFFAVLLWIIIFDMIRVCWRVSKGASVLPLAETPYVVTQLGQQV